jgi:hypothetical protein
MQLAVSPEAELRAHVCTLVLQLAANFQVVVTPLLLLLPLQAAPVTPFYLAQTNSSSGSNRRIHGRVLELGAGAGFEPATFRL